MQLAVRETFRLKLQMRQQPGYQAAFGAVFEQISAWENAVSGSTKPSQTMLAAALDVARETVCRAVGWLRRHGYIRTKQTYVRQADGSVLHGPLIYWISRDIVQAGIVKGKGLMQRYRELLERGQRRSKQAFSRCDMGSAIPSRPVSNSEAWVVPGENLASPALQRLLKEQGLRRRGAT